MEVETSASGACTNSFFEVMFFGVSTEQAWLLNSIRLGVLERLRYALGL